MPQPEAEHKRNALARLIFMADNSNAPDPEAEWRDAPARQKTYAYNIADALIAFGYVRAPLEYGLAAAADPGRRLVVGPKYSLERAQAAQATLRERGDTHEYVIINRRRYQSDWKELEQDNA